MENFQSIGKLPNFYHPTEFFQSKTGYILTDIHGGPKIAKYLENFQAREDDIVVTSFPKTGTTLLQEIVYLICSNLDFESAKTVPSMTRFPYVDMAIPGHLQTDVSKIPSPRLLKFHSAYSMLPPSIIDKKCKILFPIRNPKDTIVSFHNHFVNKKIYIMFNGDLETLVDCFVNDKVPFGPYWKFIREFWTRKSHDNIMIVAYEEMVQDMPSVIKNVAEFLGKSLSENDVIKIAQYCSFDSMKQNFIMNEEFPADFNSVHFRKGKVGDWKNHLNEEMNKKVNDYIQKYFNDFDINFVYE